MSTPAQFNLTELKNSNDSILASITNLDNLKTNVTDMISTNSASSDTNVQELNAKLTPQLTTIENAKKNLYSQLEISNSFFQNGLLATSQIKEQQSNASTAISNEVSLNNERLAKITEEQNNKMRLVEINSYYGKKYSAQNEIIKISIVVCVISLILWFIDSKEFLPIPSFFFSLLISIVITVGAIVIFYKCYYLIIRSRIDFDQIDFNVKSSSLPVINLNNGAGNSGTTGTDNHCMDGACCPPGFAYNNSLNGCIFSP